MKNVAAEIFNAESTADLKTRFANASSEDLLNVIVAQHSTIENLKQMLFQKSERRRPDPEGMKAFFDEPEGGDAEQELDDLAPFAPASTGDDQGQGKKRGKRKPLPKTLPRERVEHDLSPEQKICPKHKTPLEKIGEKVTEQLEVVPASMKVIENVTFSYKCPCCANEEESDHIVSSQTDPQPIPKSMATPTLLAYLVTSKYQDALPLYRQEKIFARYGVDLDRTTMARWIIQSSTLAQPLINLMCDDTLSARVIGCDETPLQVLDEPGRLPEQMSYMWVTDRIDGPPIVLFHYYQGRSAKVASDLLATFEGTIVCDGLKSYDSFAQHSGVRLAACMAHIRRKFYAAEKAAKKADPKATPKAKIPLDLIKALYKIEAELRGKPPDEILEGRRHRSKPLMDKLKVWLDEQGMRVLPKSLIGKAINYALGQWPKMQTFLNDPLVPIDNNRTERCIRPFVIGRNNWVFSQSPRGAQASAYLYSLIETAKANGIEPFSYLSLIFKELPKAGGIKDYEKLLPYNAKQHFDLKSYQPPK